MNHLYEVATGRLISSTALDITDAAAGNAVKASDKTGIWNTQTLDFDPYPVDMRDSSDTFWGRFSENEQEVLSEAAVAGNAKAAALMKAMSYPVVDRSDPRIINRVNAMQAAGKLDGAGRAEVILNG